MIMIKSKLFPPQCDEVLDEFLLSLEEAVPNINKG